MAFSRDKTQNVIEQENVKVKSINVQKSSKSSKFYLTICKKVKVVYCIYTPSAYMT